MNFPHFPGTPSRVPLILGVVALTVPVGAALGATTFVAQSGSLGEWQEPNGATRYTVTGGSKALVLEDTGRRPSRRMIEVDAGAKNTARVSARVKLKRVPLFRGGRRAIAVVGTKRRAAHAGLVQTRSGVRWAIWPSTGGRAKTAKFSGRKAGLQRWQKVQLVASWTTGVVTLKVDGRKVVGAKFAALRRRGAANASVGLGSGKRAKGRGLVLVRSATAGSSGASVGVVSPPRGGGPKGGAADFPYSRSSLFNRPIKRGAPTDPRSRAVISKLRQNVARTKVVLTHKAEVPPIYRARNSDPLYNVSVGGSRVKFRVPRNAQVGDGSDHPVVILNEKHPTFGKNVELRLWQGSISHSSRTISASGTGLFRYGQERRASGFSFRGQGTGSGLSIMAGLIRPEEVRRGKIEHAIRFAYSRTDFGNGFRAPANKSDQGGSGAMKMGMRLQLDRSVNCKRRVVPGRSSSSKTTRFLRMTCKALQDYGMIVMDGSSPGFMVLEMEHDETANWSRMIGSSHNGSYGFVLRDRTSPGDGLSRNSLAGIPWNKMRVVAKGN